MKKRIAILGMILGIGFIACSSRPMTEDRSETLSEEELSDSVQDTEATNTETVDTLRTQTEQKVEQKQYENTVPVVYMTNEISAESLQSLYASLCMDIKGNDTAVSISTGESLDWNTLEPEFIGGLVKSIDGTIVVCNAAEPAAAGAAAQAQKCGFTQIADVVVLDEDGSVTLPVEDGIHLKESYTGTHFTEYDGFLIISHFTGHTVTGFSGAIKNISVGISSEEGRCFIYSAGSSLTDASIKEQDAFLESMAEAGKSVTDALDKNILYINVMNHLTIEDDGGSSLQTNIPDIGILACADPVALDQACVDQIYLSPGSELLVQCMEAQNAEYVLEYAEEIGLGNSAYTLVTLEQ